MRNTRRRLMMGMLCCVLTAAAFGQGVNFTSGSITGHITDSSGGALPGVTVTATNIYTASTDSYTITNFTNTVAGQAVTATVAFFV